jgi:hypothetical protein
VNDMTPQAFPPPTLPTAKKSNAWKWILAIVAVFVLVGTFGNDDEPDPPPARSTSVADSAARQAWLAQSTADREAMCEGYRTLPSATVRAMMGIDDRQLEDAVMAVIAKEC